MGTRLDQFDFLLSGYVDPNTGLVGAGYAVTFFAADTTTPKDVYTAYDGTGGAVQTVTLDATGSAAVWGEGVYKIVIKNLSGATVDTYNGVKVFWPGFNVVSTAAATYQVTINDDAVLCDPTSTNQVITLPLASAAMRPIAFKRIAGGSNSVTIAAQGADTIDGAATYGLATINADVTLYSDGANWYGQSTATTNADTLQGYVADVLATASTIPLRNVSGKLAGSIIGYAEGGYGGAYGLSYSKLAIAYTNATTATVTADAIALSDGTNQRVFTAWNHTAVITTAGAGGLDTGAEASTTWYNIWAIAKEDGTKALLLSVSATAPTMPADYVYKRRIGTVKNNSSGNFDSFIQFGNETQFTTATMPAVASGQSAGPGTLVAYAARGALKVVPPTATNARVSTYASGTGTVFAGPNSTVTAMNGANPAPMYSGGTNACFAELLFESDNLYYASALTTSGLLCHGYKDAI